MLWVQARSNKQAGAAASINHLQGTNKVTLEAGRQEDRRDSFKANMHTICTARNLDGSKRRHGNKQQWNVPSYTSLAAETRAYGTQKSQGVSGAVVQMGHITYQRYESYLIIWISQSCEANCRALVVKL